MSEANFPSGQWIGFYTYPHRTQRYLMDLILEFRDGAVTGEGADGIGFFGLDGRYYPDEGECNWTKTYYGRHSVDYFGYREKKGIWGTWTIATTRGGFHIWPIGEGAALEKLREEAVEEFPRRVTAPKMPVQPRQPTTTAGTSAARRTGIVKSGIGHLKTRNWADGDFGVDLDFQIFDARILHLA